MASKFILGRKEGMTQVYTKEGVQVPVTVVEAGPCFVTQVKTVESDRYTAVQIGFQKKKLGRTSKPLKGHFKKAGITMEVGRTQGGEEGKKAGFTAFKNLREFRVAEDAEFNVGDRIGADTFTPGDMVTVTGTSKGRGFAGVMKRWNFAGGPAGHGAMCDRRPGSIGMHSDPSRVFKGKKMAGRYGGERVTVRGIQIYDVIPEKNIILLKGPVPGARNGLLLIQSPKFGRDRAKNVLNPVVEAEEQAE